MVSLTNLNKIILESKNIEHITNSVTEIAFKMTNSLVAWAEIYEDDKIVVTSSYQLSQNWLDEINNNNAFYEYRKEISVLDINEKFQAEQFGRYIPYANSFIYIPIIDENKKIGGICLIKNKKYNLDEDELEILKAFSVNISIAFQNVRLLKESIENERYKNELQIAKNIQEKLLPKKLIQFDDFDIDAISIQADDVGGDFYDSVRLENDDVCYLIGDVSGKGIGAAIFMAQIKGMVLSLASNCKSGKELLCKINSALYGNIDKNMFVTITAITLSNKNKMISYCRAGHTPLAVLNTNGKVEFIKSDGFGIGFVNEYLFNSTLKETLLNIDEIKMIFGFSDGLNELRNQDNNEFGYEGISFVMENYKYSQSNEFNKMILEKANLYSKTVKQFDDLTLLTLYKK
jgi:serine phosphatase RsbU (regulator of sigma subunit)